MYSKSQTSSSSICSSKFVKIAEVARKFDEYSRKLQSWCAKIAQTSQRDCCFNALTV